MLYDIVLWFDDDDDDDDDDNACIVNNTTFLTTHTPLMERFECSTMAEKQCAAFTKLLK